MPASRPSGRVGKIAARVRAAAACSRMPKFLKPFILLVTAVAAAGAFGVGTAQASRCSSALIRDWYVDGRIDQTYPVHCYREALKDIPEDQIVYGTLREDLTRALENVIQEHHGHVRPTMLVPGANGCGNGRACGRGALRWDPGSCGEAHAHDS